MKCILNILLINTSFFSKTVDAIALQICLERMEPCGEDLKTSSERKIWCDLVMSVKTPVDEMIGKSGTEGKAHVGERTQSKLMQCRYRFDVVINFSSDKVITAGSLKITCEP